MAVVWDHEKSVSNIGKHGVRFAEAVPVLEDPLGITVLDDESVPLEQRFVIHVARRGHPSDFARWAEPHEREAYEKQ